MNIDFLKQILTTNDDYWVVAREEHTNSFGTLERQKDSIWIIAVPYRNNRRGIKESEILLSEVEDLARMEALGNICLSYDYPPFQYGIRLGEMTKGFPIKENIKQFVTQALSSGETDYYKLAEMLPKKSEKLCPNS